MITLFRCNDPQANKVVDSRFSNSNREKSTHLKPRNSDVRTVLSSQAQNHKNSDHDNKENKLTDNLTPEQKNWIQKLKARDAQVRAHEAAHMTVAGAYARGGPSYSYQVGPDKHSYAIGGEIQLDASPIPDDPKATITKAEIIRKGALAPNDPSGADLAVAAAANQMEIQARQVLSAKSEKAIAEKKLISIHHADHRRKISAYRKFTHQPKLGQIINQRA
jgi:hypothetical protein